jgi:hypothetical protein
MEGVFATLVTTLGLTVLFSIVLVYSDIEEIKSHWNTRRCELPIMITAGLYKPKTYTKSSSDFASENFNYCGKKIAQEVIRVGMAPYYAIAGQQSNAQSSVANSMNNMRGMLATTTSQFTDYTKLQYKKYESMIVGITKSYMHFKFALGRVQGILYSLIYLILSLSTAMFNTLKLTLFAVKVFLGILMAMMILLFPVLNPFMLIITSATIIVAAFGLAAADAADDAMCVDPDASVRMADGSKKPLKEVKIGDILYASNSTDTINRVEGILVADGTKTSLYEIDGVSMSGSHSIFYKDSWILAKDHPKGIHVSKSLPQLICLNTTNHEVPIVGKKGTILVSDWEEVSTLQGQKAWIDYVHLVLNGGYTNVSKYPSAIPLVSSTTRIFSEVRGSIPIESVELGESIQTKDGFTTVKAIYSGIIQVSSIPTTPEWISDGVWLSIKWPFWSTSYNGIKRNLKGKYFIDGYFLITDKDTFILERNGLPIIVRDFTEIGSKNIDQSYTMIQNFMNKK